MNAPVQVLVVEDDPALNEMLVEELDARGWNADGCRTAEACLEALEQHDFDLVVTDLQLPGADGMSLLKELQQRARPPAVLMVTAFGTVERAVEALKAGADNFLTKPLNIEHFLLACQRVIEHRRLLEEVDGFRDRLGTPGFHGMIGTSPPMQRLFEQIRRIAPADGPVLVTGASGSGKEDAARALHAESRRADRPFLAVNCAAVPADLLESEFFGHAAGAFTGAERQRQGLFREADGGTLFLDEVGEMPQALQARLLRALQDGRIRPVGDEREVRVDVRVVAASNRDLEALVERGEFRSDLYFRLETFHMDIPALSERGEDIELLAQHFLLRHAAAAGRPARELDDAAIRALRAHDWPGNVRELSNAMERAATFCNSEAVGVGHLPERVRRNRRTPDRPVGSIPAGLVERDVLPTLDELRRDYVRYVLERTRGNKRRAAALLGVGRRTLYRWLEMEQNDRHVNRES